MTKETDTATLRQGSKPAILLEMLRRQDGATLDEMTERTGWQPHSVRAGMTGLRKKGHVIIKRLTGNMTAWYIETVA